MNVIAPAVPGLPVSSTPDEVRVMVVDDATVVRGLRRRIEELGGEVRFEARVEELLLDPSSSVQEATPHYHLRGVRLADGEEIMAEPPPDTRAITRSSSAVPSRRARISRAADRLPSSGRGCPASMNRTGQIGRAHV